MTGTAVMEPQTPAPRCSIANAAHAACSAQRFAGDPVRIGRGQEHGNRGDIFGLAKAAERRAGNQLLAEFAGKIAIGAGVLV